MGVTRKQDKALMADQLLLIGNISKKDWVQSNSEEEKKALYLTTEFATIAFFMSLRVEEALIIIIESLYMFWKDTRNHRTLHIIMKLKRRFKGENNL